MLKSSIVWLNVNATNNTMLFHVHIGKHKYSKHVAQHWLSHEIQMT